MTAPFKVGNFNQGQSNTIVSRQWLARPADEKFTSLTDPRDAVAREAGRNATSTKVH